MLAITHCPSPRMTTCELTFIERASIDIQRAEAQHADYCRALTSCGAELISLEANRDFPDCAFVEDTAIVLDEVAIVASMGTKSRCPETDLMSTVLERYRKVKRVRPPALIEGGDVLLIGRTLFVGQSSRTNAAGTEQLAKLARPFGYSVRPIDVHGCLHLKTACTAIDGDRLLINPNWVDRNDFSEFSIATVPTAEAFAANVLPCGGSLVVAAGNTATIELLISMNYKVLPVELDEFAKAEAGVTCLSLLVH